MKKAILNWVFAAAALASVDGVSARYVQADPIGMQGGMNRFGYANQNPLKYTDSTGLATDAEIRRAVATLRCRYPGEFQKRARSITMVDLDRSGVGRTDWLNNIEMDSRLYGDSNTRVDEFLRSEFLRTLAHESLHVNEPLGSRLLSISFRMESPLGYFHQMLDDKATSMMTTQLVKQFTDALNTGDNGCSCSR